MKNILWVELVMIEDDCYVFHVRLNNCKINMDWKGCCVLMVHISNTWNQLILLSSLLYRFYGVMVSTLDFESSDPSSNLGRTSVIYF